MKIARSLTLALLALSLYAGTSGPTHAQETATAHAEHLLKADRSWNSKPYTHYPSGQPTLTMIRLTIPPHTALPWHTHPIPNVGYVLQGQLTIQDKASGASRVFHQAMPLPRAWMTPIVVYRAIRQRSCS
ncbi:cupin domain-containing protein [Asaia platycodi]|uniref:cupin domain-containing protein n=1 Tax=Asaia platycodi TaxID=610243 RepID=UPI000A7179B7